MNYDITYVPCQLKQLLLIARHGSRARLVLLSTWFR